MVLFYILDLAIHCQFQVRDPLIKPPRAMKPTFIPIIFLSLVLLGNSVAAPPRPDAWARTADEAKANCVEIVSNAKSYGLDAAGESLVQNMRRLQRDDDAEITLNALVILVDFDDNEHNGDDFPPAHFEELLFSLDDYETGSMRDYYLENSLGEVDIIGDVVGWYRMPQDYSYYVNNEYGLGYRSYPRNAQRLAEDAIRAADDDVNYRDFDNDGDGRVEAIFVVHAGSGAEENPGNANLIWSHAWTVRQLGGMDGVGFWRYMALPEDGKIGVYGHELGHTFFSLPDLYDIENESAGIGIWSIMAAGTWGGGGDRPTHLDAWCKVLNEWVDVNILEFDDFFTLPPVTEQGEVLLLWNPDELDREYFLAENRTRVGFDESLPGGGLLIYHVDETMEDNAHPWWPDHEGNLHNLLALEQADGNWDLEAYENYGDDGDPYPGGSNNRTFDADSEPGSRDYDNEDTGVSITDIRIVEGSISAVWRIGVENPVQVHTVPLAEGWSLVSTRITPEDDDILNIFSELAANGSLLIVKDYMGRFYLPDAEFSNIPRWNSSEGYLVKMSRDDEITFRGELIEPREPIPLIQGWQMIAYYPDYTLDPIAAFNGIRDRLVIAKDGFGNFYLPAEDFNNMADLEPGRGYMLKMSEEGELVYPEP